MEERVSERGGGWWPGGWPGLWWPAVQGGGGESEREKGREGFGVNES